MSARIGLFASAIALAAVASATATAAPPPPPPAYVADVAKLLTQHENGDSATELANHIADDVHVYVNDKLVANGKADWLHHFASAQHRTGAVLGYSEGWKSGGSLMIADEVDTIEQSRLPPGMIADPRYATRTTLYEFAGDGKIHAIRAIVAAGFWMTP